MDWINATSKRFFKTTKVEIEIDKSPGKSKQKFAGGEQVSKGDIDVGTLKSLLEMFRVATPWDAWILSIGIFFTIIHGTSYPIMAVLIGSIAETFIAQSRGGYSNLNNTFDNKTRLNGSFDGLDTPGNTSSSDNPFAIIVDIFAYLGNVFGLSSTTSEIMTNEEFAACAETFSWYFVVLGLVVYISTYMQTWCWESTADHQASSIRQTFIDQMLRQECCWFECHPVGILISKLLDDVERFRDGIGYKFSLVVEYLSCFAIGAFFGFCTNARLTLIFGLSVPFIIGKILFLVRRFADNSITRQEFYGKAGAVSEEVIGKVRTVAAYGKEMDECKRYMNLLHILKKEEIQDIVELKNVKGKARAEHHYIGLGTGVMYIIIYGSFGLAVLSASNQLLHSHISRQQVYTVFCLGTVAILALSNILPYINVIAYSQGCSESIGKVTKSKPTIDPYSDGGIKPHKFAGNIKFINVMFSYPGRQAALVIRDFNLTLTPGTPIGILGSGGAGKTTLKNLLVRFYDPLSGSITFDDFELKQLNVEWLRDNVGILLSEPSFLTDTIYHNITCGKPVKLEDVLWATNIACCHHLIMELPDKYRTVIGGDSRVLSTSLKQLIGLARVLVRKPKVIILDEGLSSQTFKTGRQVMHNLSVATSDCTLVMFSSHISRLQMPGCRIHVLKGGKVVEVGDHSELLAYKGIYYQMAVSQNPEIHRTTPDSDTDTSDNNQSSNLTERESADIDEAVEREYIEDSLNYPDITRFFEQIKALRLPLGIVFFGIIGCVISGVVPPISALVFCQILTTFSESGVELTVDAAYWCKVIFAIGIAAGVGHWMRAAAIIFIAEYLSCELRTVVYLTILRQAIKWFDYINHTPERLYTILSRQPPVLKIALGERLGVVLSAIISYLVAIIISLVLEWRLGLVVAAIIPVQLFVIYKESEIYENIQLKLFGKMDVAFSIVTEAVREIRTVHALSQQNRTLEAFTHESLKFEEILNHVSRHIGISFGISEALSFVTFAAVFRAGAYFIAEGSVEPIQIFKIFIILVFSTSTIGQVTSFIPDYVKAKLAYGYLYALGDIVSTIDAFEEDGETPDISGQITFKDVHFSYDNRLGMGVLRGVSFHLKSGTFLGICGSLGKSTLLSLILRFYECNDGQVLIDGVDVQHFKLDYMREHIGYVQQKPILFNRSIRENILYGYNGELRGDELQKLLEDTVESLYLTEFIDGLPDGYDTILGHGTSRERQLLAIARAVIRDPPILLLDTPTFALSPELEMSLANALKKIAVGRTCIVVANHANMLRVTDYVAVLRNGQIVEYGTHEQLENLNGAYCEVMRADYT